MINTAINKANGAKTRTTKQSKKQNIRFLHVDQNQMKANDVNIIA